MPTNKDKLSLNIFICIYIYRIDPVIAIVFSIILWSSFLTGAKRLCKLSPPTRLCLRIKSFFFYTVACYMFMPHRRGKFAGRNSEKLSLKSAVRPGPAQQKISVKTKPLRNKTRVMHIHAGATIIRTILIIRMRTRRILFSF